MKNIHRLIPDIYEFLEGKSMVDPVILDKFTNRVNKVLATRHEPREARLSMSMLGEVCDRKNWAKIHDQGSLEAFDGPVLMKFTYGHLIEQLTLFLAEQTGHSVTGLQDQVYLGPVPGSRDVIIDGYLIDVKSASRFAFLKFKSGLKPDNDSFGYLGQLNGYLNASQDDPLLLHKEEAAFLVVNKENGELYLDWHKRNPAINADFAQKKYDVVSDPLKMPERAYHPVPSGKSGNMALGVNCSYCQYKEKCWPSMRTFLYSSGPVYLTHVAELPRVEELK
jgi:hypothetical protein